MGPSNDFNLRETQRRIQESLMNPSGVLFPSDLIKSSGRLSAEEHLAIYQRSYIARLRQCMAKQFSALEHALGKELFCQFADGYLSVFPSNNYNLITLGKQFPNYLEQTRPDRDQEEKEDWPDFMIELAKFEYAINVIFEEKAKDDYVLATEPSTDESLELIPVFHLFQFQFPVKRYYSAVANKRNPELPLPQRTWTAISRHDYRIALHGLNEGQYYFLMHFKETQDFHATVHYFISTHKVSRDAFIDSWTTWRREWIKKGLLIESSRD